jgi:tetratricopeptide (TPR) repeat protein
MGQVLGIIPPAFESVDVRRLRAVEGYIELGIYDEADREIEQIDPDCPAVSRVLALKLCIYAGLCEWPLMEAVAKKLAERNPDDAQWAIWRAYAAARGHSIEAAKKILIEALRTHPNDPRVHYALGCYESRLHHFYTAKRHVARAIQLDARLRLLALSDADLEPLWSDIEIVDD